MANQKCFIGFVNQFNPRVNFWTVTWILEEFKNALLSGALGWRIVEDTRRHPNQANAMGWVAAKPYNGIGPNSQVKLYLQAFDLGLRTDTPTPFHATEVQAAFIDPGGDWVVVTSEQLVAEAMRVLVDSTVIAAAGSDRPFWYLMRGSWLCGRALFSCPVWQG